LHERGGKPVHSPDELRALVEDYLEHLAPTWMDGEFGEVIRYSLEGGGKRIRPVLCLAVAEAAGALPDKAVPAAVAVELVHTFSLVHDDLPALDDDRERRGRPSTHVQFGEAVAILTGDALLTQALHLAISYGEPGVANELADATLNMIRGQYLDVTGSDLALEELYELKTGALFNAAVGCGLEVAGVARGSQRPWRGFAREFGVLFQVVDDISDADGLVEARGAPAARELASQVEARAREALDEIGADTAVLAELVSGLSARAGGR
jgi:geranylgeranyl diphosphate synthase, type II